METEIVAQQQYDQNEVVEFEPTEESAEGENVTVNYVNIGFVQYMNTATKLEQIGSNSPNLGIEGSFINTKSTSYTTNYINIENVQQHPAITSGQDEATKNQTIEGIQNATLELKDKLQQFYKEATLPCVAWLDKGEDLIMSNNYTELQLDVTKSQITIEQLFDKFDGKEPRRILIEGQPGYGKTTLATKLIYDWALSESYIEHFKLAFLIPLRELENQSIDDKLIKIANHVEFKDTSLVQNIIQENISNILLILDGFDELQETDRMSILKLLYKKQYSQMTVIVTCRTGLFTVKPTELSKLSGGISRKKTFYDKRAQVLGIGIEKRKEFLLKFIPPEDADHIINRIENLTKSVSNMFSSPLFLILLAFIAMYKNDNTDDEINEESALTSKTNLFKRLFNCIINRSLKSEADNQFDLFKFDSTTNGIQKTIQQFGKLSLDQLLNKKMQFKCNKLTEEIYKMGFLINQQKILKFQTITHYEAFHLSILEFSAAFSIWMDYKQPTSDSPQNPFDCFQTHSALLSETSLIPNFLVGLLQDEAWNFFHQISSQAHIFTTTENKLWNLLIECQSDTAQKKLMPVLKDFIPPCIPISKNTIANFYLSDFFEKLIIFGIEKKKIQLIRINNLALSKLPKDIIIPHLWLEFNKSNDIFQQNQTDYLIFDSLSEIKSKDLTINFKGGFLSDSNILKCLHLCASIPTESCSLIMDECSRNVLYKYIDDDVIKQLKFSNIRTNVNLKILITTLLQRNQIKSLNVFCNAGTDIMEWIESCRILQNIVDAASDSSYLNALRISFQTSCKNIALSLPDLTKFGKKNYNVLLLNGGSLISDFTMRNQNCIQSLIVINIKLYREELEFPCYTSVEGIAAISPAVLECDFATFYYLPQSWIGFTSLRELALYLNSVKKSDIVFWRSLRNCKNLKMLEIIFPIFESESDLLPVDEIVKLVQQLSIERFVMWRVRVKEGEEINLLKGIINSLPFKNLNQLDQLHPLQTIDLRFKYPENYKMDKINFFSSVITDLLKCLKLRYLKAVNIICQYPSECHSLIKLNIIDYSVFHVTHSIYGNTNDEPEFYKVRISEYNLCTYSTLCIKLKQESVD